ncbi:hypothetical protein [Streptomyces sp. NPDC057623]|uniref:hypothetical protein n=1 Tax=Streptomyces sp. NPDC057623 TaxID=3346187 RepID=UPI00367B9309
MDRIYTNHRHGERRIHIEIADNEIDDLLEDLQDLAEDDNAYDATKQLIKALHESNGAFALDRRRDAHEAQTSST